MTTTPPAPAPSAVERFDPTSPNLAVDRFPILADIQREAPVAFIPAIGMWAVTGYDAITEVLSDPERFPSGGGYTVPPHLPAEARAIYDVDQALWTYALIGTDDDLHRRLRSPMTAAFTARRVKQLEPVIAQDAAHLLDQLFSDGNDVVDLYARFVRPLPSRTIARFFGLPVEDAPRFSAWSGAFLTVQVPGLPAPAYIEAATQFAEFDTYIRQIVNSDLSTVNNGIIHSLVTGWRQGTHDLTEDELVGDIANVVFAGHETTVSTLSNMLVRMLRDPDLWTALSNGTSDVTAMVDELLRLDTSVIGLFRSTSTTTQIGEVTIPAHTPLWVAFGAANRDPHVFADPNTMNPTRANLKEQMTFGRGRHICIGATLARAQITRAITTLPRTYPTLQLAGDAPEAPGHLLRITPTIPVTRH